MTAKEAHRVLESFESGYVDPDNKELLEAARVTGRQPRVKSYQSFANPQNKLVVRTVTEKRANQVVTEIPAPPIHFFWHWRNGR